jgi:hypothetical protein
VLWILSTACIGLIAFAVQRLVRTNSASLNVAGYFAIAVGVVTAIQLGLGLVGLLVPWAVTLTCLVLAGSIGILPGTRPIVLGLPGEWRDARQTAAAWWFSLPKGLRILAGGLALTLTFRFAFLIVVLPPFVWDALTYHLTNVGAWTQSGRLVLIDSPVVRTYLPANSEVFTTWFTIFLHHDIVVEAAGIPGYLIACLAVYAMARRLGCGAPASLVACLAYATTPALLLSATGNKNDPLMAGIVLLMMALIVDLVLRRDDTPGRNALGQLALLLALAFYGLGTKAYLIHVSAGMVVVGLMLPRAAGYRGTWSGLRRAVAAQIRGASRPRLAGLLGLVVISLFLGLYWYGRNYALTGNPFYPMGIELGATTLIAGVQNNFPISLDRLAENLASFWAKLGDRSGPIVPDLPNTTGWGWIAYGIGLPTLVWAAVRLKPVRVVALGFVVSLMVLFLSARASPWNMRYAIWFPAVLCLTSACFLQALPASMGGERRVLGGLFVLGAVMNVLPTLNYGRIPLQDFARLLSKPALDRSAASLYLTVGDTYEFALATVPDDEILGYHVDPNGFIYPLYGPHLSQRIAYVPFASTDRCETIRDAVRAVGTRWLFAGYDIDYRYASRMQTCAREGLFTDRGENLYELTDP